MEHIRSVLAGVSLENFEADWRKRWLVERGLEIICEASRHDDRRTRGNRATRRRAVRLSKVPVFHAIPLVSRPPDV
ncbi:MAG: HepT-like ribonuclease domain-containing protein [Methylocella sp.]